MYNILSIDWDYFVNATDSQRYELFPDGGNENLKPWILDFIWSTHYTDGKLEKIGVDEDELSKLKKIILSQVEKGKRLKIVSSIADSHKWAYDFIDSNTNWIPYTVTNIDFHHDCYDLGENEVTCGNWIIKLQETAKKRGILQKCKYRWLKRPDSDDNPNKLLETVEWKDIENEKFDFIFLCRSGCWSPPHLDSDFINLAHMVWMVSNKTYTMEDGILHSRYTSEFLESVKQQKEMVDNVRRKCSQAV